MFVVIDNYDSFVYNLASYFEELGEEVLVYRNDKIAIEHIKSLNPEGIIISPGPKDPKETGICIDIIRSFAKYVPILGICLGHQTIAHAYGASIIQGIRPMHGKVTQINHSGEGIFKSLPSPIKVTRYHSLIIDSSTLPPSFTITATSEDNVIMGIRHMNYYLEGVQFHPEALLTEYGHQMIQNFIDFCKEVSPNAIEFFES